MSESAFTAIKSKNPLTVKYISCDILVFNSQKRLLQQNQNTKKFFEMMHSSAFINAAKGTESFDDHTKSEGVCEYHNKLLNDNPCGYHQ
ncbi:hypothetical protein LFZ31_17260 [Salmonella enterica subsp. enterica serovar Newport str. S09097]|nr:hypothetical protein LFZ31_17260 [Salmonella enterica subsp. enterica serovar Newport str. S09097]